MNRLMHMLPLAACFVFAAVPAARAETAKEVIEKAIVAHGGADNLKKITAGKLTSDAKMTYMGLEIAIEAESTFHHPDKFKNVLKMDALGKKITMNQIVNGEKVKISATELAVPVSNELKAELQESLYLQKIMLLVDLLDARKFELSSIEKPAKVGGNDVNGVLVKSKGHKDVKLFFDAKTNLLAQIDRRGLDPTEKEVDQRVIYTDVKKFGGINYPTKTEVLIDGKKFMTSEIKDFKALDKVDPKEFDLAD
ncbi:MAG: hypothetical protein K8T89_05190 [Planctomycetes bacterium]|nr:hypothetical protein [Planctomycetota bacterium]